MEQSQDHEELLLGQEEEEQKEEASAGGRVSSELPVQFLKAVSSMQMKRPDKTTEQESRASRRLQRHFANLLTSLHLIVMTAGLQSLSPNSSEVQLSTQ